MLYRIPLRLLGDLLSPKALERLLSDGARSRGTDLEGLGAAQLSEILKRDVFKRLQLSVPAPLAKRRVQEVLDALDSEPAAEGERGLEDRQTLETLEAAARRFALYFDWAESQRLRALIGVVRSELELSHHPALLLQEGLDLVGALDRRLQEGLVAQAADLAELKADLARFQAVGGPKVRRLDNLVRQIEEAQGSAALLPGEVERARKLTLDLRKLVESSVITRTSASAAVAEDTPVQVDLDLLPDDARARLQSAEREAQARELADLARSFEDLTRARPEMAEAVADLRARFEGGELVADGLAGLREQLATARDALLAEQRLQLDGLQARFEAFQGTAEGGAEGSGALDEAGLALRVARGTLEGGVLASEALRELAGTIATLEQQGQGAARLLSLQRETFELERAARDVPGASEELAGPLQQARDQLSDGQEADLAPLWAVLERRMAQAAQQREAFDLRADRVINDYDQYRSLAGETVQRLGRLADTLRAQRRLGALSSEAREKYAQTLEQAEALLDEAHAEFEAARAVTSAFGQDALAGLLDVFGGEGEGGGLFGEGGFVAPPALAPALPEALQTALNALSEEGAQLWLLRGQQTLYGEADPAAQLPAELLAGAGADTELLCLEGAGQAWLALALGGDTLVARTDSGALPDLRARLLAEAPGWRALNE